MLDFSSKERIEHHEPARPPSASFICSKHIRISKQIPRLRHPRKRPMLDSMNRSADGAARHGHRPRGLGWRVSRGSERTITLRCACIAAAPPRHLHVGYLPTLIRC